MTSPQMSSVSIVIKDGSHLYYLLKVVRRGSDVYCIPPHLGVHYSVHESGYAHFRSEGKAKEPRQQIPVALVEGEWGPLVGNGIIRAPLRDLGHASCICYANYSIDSLSSAFQKFNRSTGECFVIDKDLVAKDTHGIVIGVWAVPDSDKDGFKRKNPSIRADLLYKVAQGDPQIWIYARPF